MKGLSLDWKQQKKHVPMQGTGWTKSEKTNVLSLELPLNWFVIWTA